MISIQKIDTTVGQLVDMIQRGELRLPEMQRRYVWTAARVRDLLDSLYRGYPSGMILVWETSGENPTRTLAIDHASNPLQRPMMLLDGQQRLTSLSAVIRGEPLIVRNRKREIQIAFNLDHPEEKADDVIEVEDDAVPTGSDADDQTTSEGEDDEELSTIAERLQLRTFVVANRAVLSDPHWVLASDVFTEKKTDWEIIKPLVESPDDPNYDRYSKRLQRLRAIKNYPYVMQKIPDKIAYEEVAEIFVRVNSLGMKLRGSDLALALLTAKWPNSLKQFEQFVEECDNNTWFTLDLGLIVRAIVVFTTKQCRFRTVGSLSRSSLEEGWSKARAGLEFAVNFLRTNAGIEDESLLSSPLLLIPIAVYSQLKDERLSRDDERHLLRWLYIANARGHYSGSSETTLDADLAMLYRGQPASALMQPLESQFGRLRIEPSDFIGKGIRSALFSTAYIAIKTAGASDWFTGLGLTLTHTGRQHSIQFHHIFPKAVLQKCSYDKSEINEIANMAFITGKTNRRLSSKAPADYLPGIVSERGEDALRRQLIPMDRSLWETDNYRNFLAQRRKLLADAINEFIQAAFETGTVAQDTEA